MPATNLVLHTLDLQFCFDNYYTFVVFVGIAKYNSLHAAINNNTRVIAHIIAEDFTRNNLIWAIILCPHYGIQRVRISEVHFTRLSTVKHSGPTEMSGILCVSAFQRCPEWEVPLYTHKYKSTKTVSN